MDIATVKVLLNWITDFRPKARMDKYNYDMLYDCFEWAVYKGCAEIALLLVRAGYNASGVAFLHDPTVPTPLCFQERPDILEELRYLSSQPSSLFYIAVRCIRRSLRGSIMSQASYLPLPSLLIEDVKLSGLLT